MEPGYLILNFVVGQFTDNFQILLVVNAIIGILFFYKAMEYERKHINLGLAVFLFSTILYFYYIGIMRLFLAASITAYALKYVIEKKTAKYIIWILIASMFHYSALFMLFLVYFSTEKEEKTRKIQHIILLVTVAMPIIIYVVSQFIFPNMGERYSNNYTELGQLTFSIGQFDKLPIVLLTFFLYKDMLKENEHIKIYIVIYALAIIIGIYGTIIPIGRIEWYMNFAICIIIPQIVRAVIHSKYKNWVVLLIPLIIIYGGIYAYKTIYSGANGEHIKNYSNILFKE